ncbi:MAG: glycosyltransferase family 9 protein [Pseudomonadales bacterium]|nr:glycosyltransferase family 9 protein [Pseudomonadales bacterium]
MASRLPGRLWVALSWLKQWRFQQRQRPDKVNDIMIIHHLLLGDSLMAVSLCAQLRLHHPHASITLVLPKAHVPLFAHSPWGVQAMPLDPYDVSTLQALQQLPTPDLCLLPADNRFSWLARGLGARWIIGFAKDVPNYKNWMVDQQVPYSATPTAWSDTVTELLGRPPPPPYQPAQWLAPVSAPFKHPASRYVVLHVGASSSLKHWPADRWHHLAERLVSAGYEPVWSAGAQEEHLVSAADPQQRWMSTAGQLDLAQLWQLIAHAALLVCPDTGVAHLGRVVGTPTISLFGPGSAVLCGAGAFWSQVPYRALSLDIACRDQTTNFQRNLPWIRRCERFPGQESHQCATARCMFGLDSDLIWAHVSELLQTRHVR